MDELTNRLKRDAEAIDAEVPEALRERIDAGIASTPRAPARRGAESQRALLGWSGAVAGLAALAAIVVLLDRPAPPPEPSFATQPPPVSLPLLVEPLRVETVRLAGPLEDELDHLRADLEKARETIERDLRDSF